MEFLCDASQEQKAFFFMEMNTRLQVEHLVSQRINGDRDFVELQIRVGGGWGVHGRSRRASRWRRWA